MIKTFILFLLESFEHRTLISYSLQKLIAFIMINIIEAMDGQCWSDVKSINWVVSFVSRHVFTRFSSGFFTGRTESKRFHLCYSWIVEISQFDEDTDHGNLFYEGRFWIWPFMTLTHTHMIPRMTKTDVFSYFFLHLRIKKPLIILLSIVSPDIRGSLLSNGTCFGIAYMICAVKRQN